MSVRVTGEALLLAHRIIIAHLQARLTPLDKRRQPRLTLGVLQIEYGYLTRAEIVTLH